MNYHSRQEFRKIPICVKCGGNNIQRECYTKTFVQERFDSEDMFGDWTNDFTDTFKRGRYTYYCFDCDDHKPVKIRWKKERINYRNDE